jgi:hypothetical protein
MAILQDTEDLDIKTITFSTCFYGCKIWFFALRKEHNLNQHTKICAHYR